MFTARYGLIPYIKEITFRIEKVKARNLNLIISDSVKGHALLHVDSFSLCTYFGEKILNLVSQQYVTQHENLNLKKKFDNDSSVSSCLFVCPCLHSSSSTTDFDQTRNYTRVINFYQFFFQTIPHSSL